MEIAGKKVIVVGLARSGVAAARLLLRLGARVVATDTKSPEELPEGQALQKEGVQLALEGHPPELLAGARLLVVSPGVPGNIPFLQEARRRGIPLWSEVELAYRYCPAPILAITGANGKTTTTSWLGEMLKAGGRKVVVAGNIGTPLTAVVGNVTPEHLVVAEISSFQLEGTHTFRPRLAALLNLTADHLDRHGSFAAYKRAKARIFANQDPSDYSILNADDGEVRSLAGQVPGRLYWFSRQGEPDRGAFVREGYLVLKDKGELYELCPVRELALPGEHNLENGLAAALMAYLAGTPIQAIAGVLRNFAGIEHRCERVAEIGGVKFVNDSKGTNPEATIKALQAFTEPIILIAGGRSKGSDFSQWAKIVKERVKKVILLGEAAPLLEQVLTDTGYYNIERVVSLEEAVAAAYRTARAGECVLLSPACASWDMFSSYEERGRAFKEAVAQLGRGRK